jgi:hypothetical protein
VLRFVLIRPVSHQWATGGHDPTRWYAWWSLYAATLSWFAGVIGAYALPSTCFAQARQVDGMIW